jgi:hypothetical protein
VITNILAQFHNETALFWQDITSSVTGSLIDGQFPNSGAAAIGCGAVVPASLSTTPGTTYIGDYLPTGKIGHGTFIYVYDSSGFNWFGISAVTSSSSTTLLSSATIPAVQAYNVDKKVDDGLPATGAVQVNYINNSISTLQQSPSAATDTTTTCYNTTSNAYSVSSLANYGAGGNCALSFRFQ